MLGFLSLIRTGRWWLATEGDEVSHMIGLTRSGCMGGAECGGGTGAEGEDKSARTKVCSVVGKPIMGPVGGGCLCLGGEWDKRE